jgi:hypothetical protein
MHSLSQPLLYYCYCYCYHYCYYHSTTTLPPHRCGAAGTTSLVLLRHAHQQLLAHSWLTMPALVARPKLSSTRPIAAGCLGQLDRALPTNPKLLSTRYACPLPLTLTLACHVSTRMKP